MYQASESEQATLNLQRAISLDGISARGGSSERIRAEFADHGMQDLYFFTQGILQYNKLVPHAHGHLCNFLMTCKALRRMTQMPRSHFKTTIVTISQTIWDIVKNPELRILLVAASGMNASRFMSEIQNHFTDNQIFRWLYPHVIPEDFSKVTWNAQEMEVPRTGFWREPTIDTIGSRGAVESRHYDIIRPDDIIGEKEYNSDTEMEKTCEWATGLESLLISPITGQIDYTGTRWKPTDVYAFLERFFGHGEKRVEIGPHAYKVGELVLFHRAARENGKPIFPELVSEEFLTRMQRENPQRYAAQYANDPLAEGLTTFHQGWLKYYTLEYNDEGEASFINFTDIEGTTHRISVWNSTRYILYDPSVSESKKAAYQALLAVAQVEVKGRIYFFLLETCIGHIAPDKIVDEILRMDKAWNPDIFSIEKFGFQAVIKYWVRERCAHENLPEPSIREFPPKGVPNSVKSKADRIRGLQPIFRNGQFYILEGQKEFIDEYTYYPNGLFVDALDALAQLLVYAGHSWEEQAYEDRMAMEAQILATIGPSGYSVRDHCEDSIDWKGDEPHLTYPEIRAAKHVVYKF